MILQLVALLVGVLTFAYYRIWKKLKLWSSMGLAEDPGSFVMGSQPNSDALSQKSSFNDMFDQAYEKFRDQKMWGSYGMFGEPHLIINDLDLAKDVLIKVRVNICSILPEGPKNLLNKSLNYCRILMSFLSNEICILEQTNT